MRLAVSFTNLGHYHAARLRGLAAAMSNRFGPEGRVVAIETASVERKYPWESVPEQDGFERRTLHRNRTLEEVPATSARHAMRAVLDAIGPDAVAVAGYVRPECLAARQWAKRHGRPCILMSESQAIDRPRVWWKERIKRARVRSFDAALVGGTRHRDYLVELGMDPNRIALGYNAVDHGYFAEAADRLRADDPAAAASTPYFLTVCRFVPEKGLDTLLEAYARYRHTIDPGAAWGLVVCGGGPLEARLRAQAESLGIAPNVVWPGFLGAAELVAWYARAGAFVLPSRSEPWGLVANEAAACGVPLLLSDAAGCTPALVAAGEGSGASFPPDDPATLTHALAAMAGLPASERREMGRRARAIASAWGPERFGRGLLEALDLAWTPRRPRVRAALSTGSRRP
jgi:glycosyltransferase involved in cell wall biosynthesis